MNVTLNTLRASKWVGGELTASRSIVQETSVGLRQHDIAVSFSVAGERVCCFLGFFLNYQIALKTDLDAQWLPVVVKANEAVAATGVFKCRQKSGKAEFYSDNPDTVRDFVVAMASEGGASINVMADDGVALSLPVPPDTSILQVVSDMRRMAEGQLSAQD